ncbi:MAG: hypothetical protein ABIP29_00210, partial [Candidatus Eisenbacteria bacterium]
YLSASIFDFGPPHAVAERLREAGFPVVSARPLLLGAVALFDARRANSLPALAGADAGTVQSRAASQPIAQPATPPRAEAPVAGAP